MVRGDLHYGVVACIDLYSGVIETYIVVYEHVYNYKVMRGDINYGVVACTQIYSGENKHTLSCSTMYTVIQW